MKSKKRPARKAKSVKKTFAPYRLGSASVSFALDVKREGLESIFGAAYMLTDRAFSVLEGDRAKKITVTLTPKKPVGRAGLEALAATFSRELETQKVRWAVAKNNLPIREYVAEQAVSLANAPAPVEPSEPASEELTDEQRKEIEKLISEVEDEIKAMNSKNAASDPKNVKASWEEAQETKASEGKA